MFPLLNIVVIILRVEILAFGDGHRVVSVYSYGSLVLARFVVQYPLLLVALLEMKWYKICRVTGRRQCLTDLGKNVSAELFC